MSNSARAGDAWLRIADLILLSFALPLSHRLHALLLPNEALPALEGTWRPLVIALVLWVASAWLHRVYEERPRAGWGAVGRVGRSLAVVALVFGALALAFSPREPGRLLVLLYFATAFVLLASNRALFSVLALAARRRGYSARRYAVVGAGGMGREVVEAIEAHPEWGLRFEGFVTVDPAGARTRGPILGRVSQLERILSDHVVDEVIFAVPRESLDVVERAVPICEEYGVEYQICLDLLRFGQSSVRISGIDGILTLAFTRTPTDTLALGVKRAFDVAASAAVLLLLSPLLAAVALAIKLDSPGPVFFRQRRSGLNGRVFHMLKFRSMYMDAEERLEALKAQNEMSGPVFKMANDPRVTTVGRFLRRTSLDEFPQFWNVLRGEMSVVGPRPPIPAEVRQYKRWQRRRLSMKPGITCIWQISGRNNIDFDHWMELDLEYIDHWSLWTDLEICVKTIPAVLSARGAR